MSPTYHDEIARRRATMDAELRTEDGWLTLIGLFWLAPGEQCFGSAPENAIVLPAGKAPAHAGSFVLEGDEVWLQAAPGAPLLLNGEPVERALLRPETGGKYDLITLGDLAMFVIKRGERYAIRARDRQHTARASFAGRQWLPADPAYRLRATFTPYDPPRTLPIMTIVGTIEPTLNPGFLTFTLHGQEHRLDVFADPAQLAIIFRDQTSGDMTYPAGRFLKAPLPQDGVTELDFNMAYNPPCAFTEFATCPLPPPQNRLPVRIEAGELYNGHA